MHRRRIARVQAGMLAVITAAAVSGCTSSSDTADISTASEAPTSMSAATTTATTTQAATGFDPDSAPLSDVELGTFPYFTIPAGFENPNNPDPITERDRVPLWTGQNLEWVIGKVHQSLIHAEEDTGFSKFALFEAVEAEITAAGGIKLTESKIPQTMIETIDRDLLVAYSSGYGNIYSDKVITYLVRQSDRRVWVHLTADTAGGSWLIVEEKTTDGQN